MLNCSLCDRDLIAVGSIDCAEPGCGKQICDFCVGKAEENGQARSALTCENHERQLLRGKEEMAIVRELKPKTLEKYSRHTECDATYSIVESDGNRMLQIDTYGSDRRANPGKGSQSIRLS